jgi:hypothetical protein
MTIQQLIDALEALPDKTKRVVLDDGQDWWTVRGIDDSRWDIILLN